MRYRLDEKRLPQTRFRSLSESLESEFAGLSAKIDEVLESPSGDFMRDYRVF
jgi:hypothetical protein